MMIALVKNIQLGLGTEEEIENMVRLFAENVPDPKAIDYVFAKKYENLSAEQIVEKAISYKPIQL